VAKGQIYVIGSADGNKTESVFALTVADGKPIWSINIGKVAPNRKAPYPGTRSTPTVDGDRVYALGSDGDLVCLDTAKGKLIWSKSLRKDFGGMPGWWEYAESPLIDGDALICSPGGDKATMVALNKTDGKVIWQCVTPGADMAAYASPMVAELGGIRQYVQFLDKGLVGVDAKTGKFLWSYAKTVDGQNMNCATPIIKDGQVLTSTISKGPAVVKLLAEGDKLTAKEVYFTKALTNHHGGMVLVGNHVYGTNGSDLVCVEFATGEVKWQAKAVGKGSVCCADGCLYVRGEKGGAVALVDATPAAYKEKGRFTPPGSTASNVWPHPVVANGCLYLRDHDNLFCYDVKAK
jgi:outer membrane protein assembly factor BamB